MIKPEIYVSREKSGMGHNNAAALIKKAAAMALDAEGVDRPCLISVMLTDNEGIRETNRDFRGIDAATDVLSFPMVNYETPGDFSFLEEDSEDCFDPDSGELLLGDIVISADKVAAQAEEYGHSRRREYAFLIAHSMLHLMGYDHMTPEDAAEMERLQEEILQQLGISRQ